MVGVVSTPIVFLPSTGTYLVYTFDTYMPGVCMYIVDLADLHVPDHQQLAVSLREDEIYVVVIFFLRVGLQTIGSITRDALPKGSVSVSALSAAVSISTGNMKTMRRCSLTKTRKNGHPSRKHAWTEAWNSEGLARSSGQPVSLSRVFSFGKRPARATRGERRECVCERERGCVAHHVVFHAGYTRSRRRTWALGAVGRGVRTAEKVLHFASRLVLA